MHIFSVSLLLLIITLFSVVALGNHPEECCTVQAVYNVVVDISLLSCRTKRVIWMIATGKRWCDWGGHPWDAAQGRRCRLGSGRRPQAPQQSTYPSSHSTPTRPPERFLVLQRQSATLCTCGICINRHNSAHRAGSGVVFPYGSLFLHF